jgi:hypothetical protein
VAGSDGTGTEVPLFAVHADGRMTAARDGRPPDARSGDTVIVLSS